MSDVIDRGPTLSAGDLHSRVREAAFALLMTGRRPVSPDEIGAIAGVSAAPLRPILVELAAGGWIDRSATGQVTGSAGLSLTDGPHRLAIGGDEFRTWCAYDSLGIAAALDADATIETACPVCDVAIRVRMSAGAPPAHRPERLWLAGGGGSDLRADFCAPTVLLSSAEHATVWADQHERRGRAVDLDEAARLGREAWAGCAKAVVAVRGRPR